MDINRARPTQPIDVPALRTAAAQQLTPNQLGVRAEAMRSRYGRRYPLGRRSTLTALRELENAGTAGDPTLIRRTLAELLALGQILNPAAPPTLRQLLGPWLDCSAAESRFLQDAFRGRRGG